MRAGASRKGGNGNGLFTAAAGHMHSAHPRLRADLGYSAIPRKLNLNRIPVNESSSTRGARRGSFHGNVTLRAESMHALRAMVNVLGHQRRRQVQPRRIAEYASLQSLQRVVSPGFDSQSSPIHPSSLPPIHPPRQPQVNLKHALPQGFCPHGPRRRSHGHGRPYPHQAR